MTDENWLGAIAKYGNSSETQRELFVGGTSQLASELRHCAKNEPARFTKFMSRIPLAAPDAYIIICSGVLRKLKH